MLKKSEIGYIIKADDFHERKVVMNAYTPDAVRQAEKYLFENNKAKPLELMKMAAQRMYEAVSHKLKRFDVVCVLCGKGNNAGDGYELARILRSKGHNVLCISMFGTPPATDIAKDRYDAFLAEGGKIESDFKSVKRVLTCADVIIDSIFGIGFTGVIEQDSVIYKLIDTANYARGYKIALDVPSGIRSSDGSVGNIAFVAD